jgi:phosphonate transport system ATP-binding protein
MPALNGCVAHAEGLTKRYAPGVTALDAVSLRVRPGEFVAVLGSRGAGQTTRFRCLPGLTRPDRGAVTINGHDMENVLVGRLAHVPTWRAVLRRFAPADRQLALASLDTVGLLDRAYTRADELPGASSSGSRSPGRWRRTPR